MKTKSALLRVITVVGSVLALVGGLPLEQVRAAPVSQAAGEGWMEAQLPAPDHFQVSLSPVPPTPSPEAQSLMQKAQEQSRLPAPEIPVGAPTDVRVQRPSIKTSTVTANTLSSPSDLVVYQDSPLTTATSSSQPNSPVAANNGRDIFATYNNYAAISLDYGDTWYYINPATTLTNEHGGFGGQQDVIYDPSRDLMLWITQYLTDSTGNALRISVSKGATQLEGNTWVSWKFEPTTYCGTSYPNSAFDRAQLALTNNYVYVAANVYDNSGTTALCTTMIRVSLDELAAESTLDLGILYASTVSGAFNFTPAQGGTDTLYFARHKDSTHLRVYDWPESQSPAGVTSVDVANSSFTGSGYSCVITSTSIDPCSGDDPRLTTGWLRQDTGELGFAWDAAQDGTHAYPYVRMLTMVASDKSSPTEYEIGNSLHAWMMSSAAANGRGHVGGTIVYAGASYNPSCAVWVDDDLSDLSSFTETPVVSSDTVPSLSGWGQYFRTRQNSFNTYQWIGSCTTITGGVVTPHMVRFGRLRDADTQVTIAGTLRGTYNLLASQSTRESYSNLNNGPVDITNTAENPLIASMRINLKTSPTYLSYGEFMGLPISQLSDSYIFPWYNNAASGGLDSQLRFGNVGTLDTTVSVSVGGVLQDSYPLTPNESTRVSYFDLNNGPVVVSSSPSVPIIASMRINLKKASIYSSYTEFMGLSSSSTAATGYMFPWYNNATSGGLDSQLRFGNVGASSTNVTVKVGGVVQGTYPLTANESTRISYSNLNNGSVEVDSSGGVPIIASMRVNLKKGTAFSSYSEFMGLSTAPETSYLFPWYNNAASGGLDSQLRFGNVGAGSTTVTVKIAGVVRGTYPLDANQSLRVSYFDLNNGPVVVSSSGGVPIIASMRINLKSPQASFRSYAEFLGLSMGSPVGLPGNELGPTYLFPWYNNANSGGLDSQLRFGRP